MKTGNEVNEIIIDGMSESYVINNLVQGVRYLYTIMVRDSINRNGIESPPVEFIVDSKYTLLYTLFELTNQIARLQVAKYLLINSPGSLINP